MQTGTATEVTAQSLFDTTVRHLAGMQEQSTLGTHGGIRCAYRGQNGSKCAVGVHLSDDECRIPQKLIDAGRIPTRSINLGDPCIDTIDQVTQSDFNTLADLGLMPERLMPYRLLLQRLQGVHDGCNNWNFNTVAGPRRDMMGISFRVIALDHKLSIKAVDALFPKATAAA